jgi:hypothetical protein
MLVSTPLAGPTLGNDAIQATTEMQAQLRLAPTLSGDSHEAYLPHDMDVLCDTALIRGGIPMRGTEVQGFIVMDARSRTAFVAPAIRVISIRGST